MYAVIFKAKIAQMDEEYFRVARKMRELAMKEHGCIDFISSTEGEQEIAISYWENEEAITTWRQNSEHLLAQDVGKKKWYESYSVEVAKIERAYRSDS